jgi:hypothetical protein
MRESTRTGVGETGAPEPAGAAAEPRWPMATAVLAATILFVGTPHSGRARGPRGCPGALRPFTARSQSQHGPSRADSSAASASP